MTHTLSPLQYTRSLGSPTLPSAAARTSSSHTDTGTRLCHRSLRCYWSRSALKRNIAIPFPLSSVVNSPPARPCSRLHSWMTHCKCTTCEAQTLHQRSGNREWNLCLDVNKMEKKNNKKNPKTQRERKAFGVKNMKTCVLISHSGLSGSKEKQNALDPGFAELRPPFGSIALSSWQSVAWLLSFIKHTVYPRVQAQPCWLRAGPVEHLWHTVYDQKIKSLMH